MDRIQYLLIGHTHYDHCGAIPYLRRRYPHLQVLASREAEKLFGMEKAQRNMRTFSHQVMQEMGLPLEFEGVSLEFDKIHVDRTLEDGDRVDLGSGLSFGVIETPGHSRCSMTLYEPQEKWLFPSDSMAVPVGKRDRFMSTASESFIVYLDSLKKLAALDTRLCAWEHFGVMTDEDARDIVRRVIRYTLEYKRRLVEHVGQTGDVEETARWAARDYLATTGFEFLTFDVMLHIARGNGQKRARRAGEPIRLSLMIHRLRLAKRQCHPGACGGGVILNARYSIFGGRTGHLLQRDFAKTGHRRRQCNGQMRARFAGLCGGPA